MTRPYRVLWWGGSLLLAGALIAFPPIDSGALLAIAGLALLSAFTPLVPLLLLVALAPMRALVATEAPGVFPADPGQLLLVATIGAWGVHGIARHRRLPQLKLSPVFIALAGFIGVAALTAFGAASLDAWLREWLKWAQMLVLAVIVSTFGGQWRWIAFALVGAGVAHAGVGAYQFFGGSGADHLLINERNFRAFGTFGQPNPFGAFMGLLAPLALMMAVGNLWAAWDDFRAGRNLPLGHLALTAVFGTLGFAMVIGLVMSWSRGAWLGFVGSVGVMAFALPRKLWQSFALVVAGGVMIAGLWATGNLPVSITARLSTITDELFSVTDVRGVEITTANYAIVERLAHWQAALRMAEARPWLGVGLGNYEVVYSQYRLINWDEPLGHAHNYYLNMLAEAGLIGLVTYLTFWGFIVLLTWCTRRHPGIIERCFAVGLLGSWAYLSIHSLTDNLYVNNMFLHLGVMLGLLSIIYGQINGEDRLV